MGSFYYKLIESNPITPRIYGIPKIHKEGAPLRYIVNTIGGPTYLLEKYLAGKLRTPCWPHWVFCQRLLVICWIAQGHKVWPWGYSGEFWCGIPLHLHSYKGIHWGHQLPHWPWYLSISWDLSHFYFLKLRKNFIWTNLWGFHGLPRVPYCC